MTNTVFMMVDFTVMRDRYAHLLESRGFLRACGVG